MKMHDSLKKDRQELVASIINDLQNGKVFFWDSHLLNSQFQPRNAIEHVDRETGEKKIRFYHGVNRMRLMIATQIKGFKDPRWITYNMAEQLGGHIKKGEHGTHIEFWKWGAERKESLDDLDDISEAKYRTYPLFAKPFTVFNVEQTEGLDLEPLPEIKTNKNPMELNAAMENMLKNSEAKINYDQLARNYYSILEDQIHVVPKDMFDDVSHAYATYAHEIAHSTGAAQRLNRPSLVNGGSFGTVTYAKEELRAELASMFIAQEYQLSFDDAHYANHSAYIQSWVKVLQDDPNEIFKAAADAEKAVKYIKTRMIEKGLTSTVEHYPIIGQSGIFEKDDFIENDFHFVNHDGIIEIMPGADKSEEHIVFPGVDFGGKTLTGEVEAVATTEAGEKSDVKETPKTPEPKDIKTAAADVPTR